MTAGSSCEDDGDAVFGDDQGIGFAGDLITDPEEDIGMVCEEDGFSKIDTSSVCEEDVENILCGFDVRIIIVSEKLILNFKTECRIRMFGFKLFGRSSWSFKYYRLCFPKLNLKFVCLDSNRFYVRIHMTGGSCCEDEGDEVCEMVKV
ncbi:hypothetical protein HHI36_004955 [Cryptolaemus montrouzieri]|uniref:Uncharacterized protein n=1 Tax=Cryptolaemus montrouzieri TaxID=559131 RepID=A0ABD2NSR0_9CUCU